ncbi:DUF1684 domain-containing protein [Luteimonas yindakuii]|uniref:DUF1684 domain-containing protein n=1 Tax=Luteimonas yindakuii TaxID=2565782 RepID=A0A4Z1RJI7_9GAMM|nr:DUF1684 domain-containing protein [Luteimonas yindakuii]TKS54279.1 DUF1684 domain-containing protein [Luteimonas yindakuii]
MTWRWLGMALLVLLTGCTGDEGYGGGPATIDPAYLHAEQQWRLERARALQADDGWTTLVGLHWLELKAHYIGNGPRAGINLGIGPPRLALVQQEAGQVHITPERDVALTVDGAPLRGRTRLRSDHEEASTRIGFDAGRGELTLIERGGRRALRVRHLDAPARLRFAGLRFWSPDPSWRMQAKWLPHPPGQTLDIVNILGQVEAMPNPGAVEFERDGQAWRLEAVDGGDSLLVMFADGTSGHGSYGAGRYLDAPRPDDASGELVLDFNRAYNPPCAYTRHATCPLPPPGNRLRLAIEAGEQAYPGEVL